MHDLAAGRSDVVIVTDDVKSLRWPSDRNRSRTKDRDVARRAILEAGGTVRPVHPIPPEPI